jgi:hypothetical protein
MTKRVGLHPATDLIQHEIRELHHEKRVSDLDCVREQPVKHRPIRTRQIQRHTPYLRHPLDRLLSKPPATARSITTRHNIKELAAGDVNDLGRPQPVFERSIAAEQHLIEPNRCRRPDAIRVLDQPEAAVVHGIHHGVPVATQIGIDLRHCPSVMANLERRPTPRLVGDPSTVRCDPLVDLNEGDNVAGSLRAPPSLLRPDKSGSSFKARQINKLNIDVVVTPRRASAGRTSRSISACADHDS